MSIDDARFAAIDERMLVERVRHGDQAAFGSLFAAHAASLYSYAQRFTRSRAAAQDIVHDVFVRIWERRDAWVIDHSVGAYLHTAVRRRALNFLRRVAVEDRYQPDAESAAKAGPEEMAEASDCAAAVARAIDQLPPLRREILILHRQSRLTCAEIGALLGIKPKSVENHVARALKTLRALLAAYLTLIISTRLSGP